MIVDISILMGCDYCSSAYGLGPIKSYELIMKYNTIENIVKNVHVEINMDYKFTRKYFLKPNVIPCNNLEKWKQFKKCDKQVLATFLETFHFKNKYIDKVYVKCCT